MLFQMLEWSHTHASGHLIRQNTKVVTKASSIAAISNMQIPRALTQESYMYSNIRNKP